MRRFWHLFLALIVLCVFFLSYFLNSFIQNTLQNEESRKALAAVQRNLAAVPPKVPEKVKKYALTPLDPSEYKKYGIVEISAEQIPRTQSEYHFYVENSLERNKFWDKEDSKAMLEDVKKNFDSQEFKEKQKHLEEMTVALEAKMKENPPDKESLELKLRVLYYGQAFRNAVEKRLRAGL